MGTTKLVSPAELSAQEAESLRSQFVISKPIGRSGRRYIPYVFTEQGVAMQNLSILLVLLAGLEA